ncbi:hypothetical protein [Hyphomicrobium sp. 1Nfss2.1]|uniref:hypothetical protein n=1 Tax=Hyphomicrobium sp. 1Nfss2.1 TaxID=3413936 RepID=UPI003C7BE778
MDALGQSGDAVIVMTAVIDRNQEMSCMSVALRTPDNKTPRTVSGKTVSSVKLGTRTILDPSAEVTGSAQIAPGTYKVVEASCSRPDKSGTLKILSSDPKGFATFSVAAGEVVNLGKLIIIEVIADQPSFMQPARYVYVSHVAALSSDPRSSLNKDLAARLIDRPMTISHPPLPQAELARICRLRREAKGISLATRSPAACTLAGL